MPRNFTKSSAKTNIKVSSDFIFVEGDGKNLDNFYICEHQVTQKEYEEVMSKNPSYFKGFLDNPVECVSWLDAIEYCNKRSEKEGFKLVYYQSDSGDWQMDCSANGYRLPTSAEWEWAAKGGVKTKGYKYSGSDNIDEVAWYKDNSNDTTHPIMQKKPNELGLYDMTGNVWEWVWDIHCSNSSWHFARGGSWYWDIDSCELSHLFCSEAFAMSGDLGIRLVRSFN